MAYPLANNMAFSAFEIVGSHLCVSSSDGQKVYERIASALKEKRSVTLSFVGITTLTATFLNTAIGQLYGLFNEDKIRSLLKVQDMQSSDLVLLKRVVETAKLYFNDLNR